MRFASALVIVCSSLRSFMGWVRGLMKPQMSGNASLVSAPRGSETRFRGGTESDVAWLMMMNIKRGGG